MKIVIGNKGSFFYDLIEKYNKNNISIIPVEITDDFNIETIDKLCTCNVSSIIYIGGETRFDNKMEMLNNELPKKIYDVCCCNKIDFLYLSSLSVFGWTDDDYININSTCNPCDFYGITKNKFDEYVNNNYFESSKVCRIYPASIHSGKGRSSIEKFDRILESKKFFKKIAFPGSLSYIYKNTLIDLIFDKSLSIDNINIIASENKMLSDFCDAKFYCLPKTPKFIFTLLKNIIGSRKALILKMILRGIIYK